MMELVNVGGTHNVLTAAAQRHVPVVHVSSVASFGPTGTNERDETYWCDDEPVVAYERTKREAHLLARRFAAEGGGRCASRARWDLRLGRPERTGRPHPGLRALPDPCRLHARDGALHRQRRRLRRRARGHR